MPSLISDWQSAQKKWVLQATQLRIIRSTSKSSHMDPLPLTRRGPSSVSRQAAHNKILRRPAEVMEKSREQEVFSANFAVKSFSAHLEMRCQFGKSSQNQ